MLKPKTEKEIRLEFNNAKHRFIERFLVAHQNEIAQGLRNLAHDMGFADSIGKIITLEIMGVEVLC